MATPTSMDADSNEPSVFLNMPLIKGISGDDIDDILPLDADVSLVEWARSYSTSRMPFIGSQPL